MGARVGKENPSFKHGYRHTRLYRTYSNMKQRCNNSKNHKYPRYGGRGIRICDEWNSPNGLKSFGDWAMSNGYADNLTLDRIDNNGDYCPENCRFVDLKTQSNNRSDNDFITYNGQTHSLTEWSEILGINRGTLWKRVHKYNWPIERAFTESSHIGKNGYVSGTIGVELLEFNGEIHSFKEWEAISGVKDSIIRERIHCGWNAEDAIFIPKLRSGIPYQKQIDEIRQR